MTVDYTEIKRTLKTSYEAMALNKACSSITKCISGCGINHVKGIDSSKNEEPFLSHVAGTPQDMGDFVLFSNTCTSLHYAVGFRKNRSIDKILASSNSS